jgi:hypothetical protein
LFKKISNVNINKLIIIVGSCEVKWLIQIGFKKFKYIWCHSGFNKLIVGYSGLNKYSICW